jgi:hypothetical protein
MTEQETPQIEQRESIKLIKNSKGYTWEIKIISRDKHIEMSDVDRLDVLNVQMGMRFSGAAKQIEGFILTRENE